MDSQHTVCLAGLVTLLQRFVVAGNELVVLLSPGEDLVPVTQTIRDDWQSVPPGLHYRLDILQTVLATMQQTLEIYLLIINNYKI